MIIRIIKRMISLVHQFYIDVHEASLRVAVARLYRDLPIYDWKKKNELYMRSVFKYINNQYGWVVEKCEEDYSKSNKCNENNSYIWVMWWQGESCMPEIVKACYERLRAVSRNYEVVLISKENVKRYIDIPEFIYDKVAQNVITLAHFSDIIRVALLTEYGGTWIDATIYAERLPEELDHDSFFSLRLASPNTTFISEGLWASFFLHDVPNSLLMNCCRNLLLEYWKRQNYLIDYFLIDYVIAVCKYKSDEIEKTLNSANPYGDFFRLGQLLNEPYDESKMEKIIQDAPLQKLSYKKAFRKEVNGKETFYSHLISQKV